MPSTPSAPSHQAPSKSHAVPLALEAFAFVALVAAVVYLFKTNTVALHWAQGYNPTGSFLLSTLVAALPIVVLLGSMAVLRLKAHVAALAVEPFGDTHRGQGRQLMLGLGQQFEIT